MFESFMHNDYQKIVLILIYNLTEFCVVFNLNEFHRIDSNNLVPSHDTGACAISRHQCHEMAFDVGSTGSFG